MCEDHRLIAVEIVHQPVIRRKIQQRDAQYIVVTDAAHHNIAFRDNCAHHADVASGQGIPGIGHFRKNNFVEGLKRHLLLPGRKPHGDFLPQLQKALLKRFIIEETFAVHSTLEWIKRITVAFMQINQHT